MDNNYVYVEDTLEQDGFMAISRGVFRAIAQETLAEHKYTKLAQALPFTDNIQVDFEDDYLVISIQLKVKAGNEVMQVVQDIQEKIHDTIEHKTNVNAIKVNLDVVGFVF